MIHPTAIVDKKAILENNVEIGPYVVVDKGVVLGSNVYIGPHAYIKGDTHIGDNTFVGAGAVIGELPQVSGMKENKGKLRIGKSNILREYVTVNSSSSPDTVTAIGDNDFFMAYSHIAHDCKIGNKVVICSGTLIAGHVEIQDNAFISGNVVIHQFSRIGRLAMIGGLSRVNQDVPPFMLLVGDSRIWGINLVGLKRAGFKLEQIKEIKNAFNVLYRKKRALKSALEELGNIPGERTKEVFDFIRNSKRGICGPNKNTLLEKIFLDYPYLLFLKIPVYRLLSKINKNKYN